MHPSFISNSLLRYRRRSETRRIFTLQNSCIHSDAGTCLFVDGGFGDFVIANLDTQYTEHHPLMEVTFTVPPSLRSSLAIFADKRQRLHRRPPDHDLSHIPALPTAYAFRHYCHIPIYLPISLHSFVFQTYTRRRPKYFTVSPTHASASSRFRTSTCFQNASTPLSVKLFAAVAPLRHPCLPARGRLRA